MIATEGAGAVRYCQCVDFVDCLRYERIERGSSIRKNKLRKLEKGQKGEKSLLIRFA